MKTTQWLVVFLLGLFVPFCFLAISRTQEKVASTGQYFAYVGTYTTSGDWRGQTKSKGIYGYRFDPEKGAFTLMGVAAETIDPSFLAVHPSEKYLYAVNEIGNFNGGITGAVSAFAIDRKTGALKRLNQVSSRGAGPCHLSVDKTGNFVLVANYDSGSVVSFPVRDDGSLGPSGGFVEHSGSGPNKERQAGPHAHWIGTSPDNRFALAVDLGLDEVVVYRFDSAMGRLTPSLPGFAKLNPGAGPRHFAFHPSGKFGYVVNELDSSVTAFSFQPSDGSLKTLQTTSTLPKDYTGKKSSAEIVVHPSGRFLYASNRGYDSVAIFTIDPARGTLTSIGQVPTKGKTPRHIAIDPTGTFLFAENQQSNNIVVFRIDPATGSLAPTDQVVEVQAPVCMIFIAAE